MTDKLDLSRLDPDTAFRAKLGLWIAARVALVAPHTFILLVPFFYSLYVASKNGAFEALFGGLAIACAFLGLVGIWRSFK